MSGRRVLVVEDNPLNMQLMAAILDSAGYAVLQADNAEDGLEAARRERPALVFMDIQLPRMDGLEATRLLKADASTRAIPVVAVTAYAMKGDRERILAAGCDDYIAKPVSYKLVLEVAARLAG